MKNEAYITDDGKKIFRDRSVGVVMVAVILINNVLHVLCNKRGKRTSEAALLWNLPSGYLDWDETGEQAAIRETYEECGIQIPIDLVKEVEHSTSPSENRQNIIFRYFAQLPSEFANIKFSTEHSEEDEVRDVKWIPVTELDNYEFAWKQKETILRIISKHHL